MTFSTHCCCRFGTSVVSLPVGMKQNTIRYSAELWSAGLSHTVMSLQHKQDYDTLGSRGIHIRPSAAQPRSKRFKFIQCSHMNFVLILRQNENHSARLKSGVRLINNTLTVWPRSLSAASNLPSSSSSCCSGKTRIIRAAISLPFQTFRFKGRQMHSWRRGLWPYDFF